ncbi:UNVERIFIED_CONTAM: hypothetical protein NCL1_53276 [Trichonephila clavipes]
MRQCLTVLSTLGIYLPTFEQIRELLQGCCAGADERAPKDRVNLSPIHRYFSCDFLPRCLHHRCVWNILGNTLIALTFYHLFLPKILFRS